jgi:hypothetical protein
MKQKFIMLGERDSRGRISKNEKYRLGELFNILRVRMFCKVGDNLNYKYFDRLFNIKKYQDYLLQKEKLEYNKKLNNNLIKIELELSRMIEEDKVGRNTRRK